MQALHSNTAQAQAQAQNGPVTYLLHYRDSYGHAQHLLHTWEPAISEYQDWRTYTAALYAGSVHGLNEVQVNRGVDFEIVRTWAGGLDTWAALRRSHNNRRLCPRCLYGRVRQLFLFGRFYL